MVISEVTQRLPPLSTRLLCKDEPDSSPMPGMPFSAILLGSPGETMIDTNNLSAKVSKDGTRSGLQGVLRDLMLARAFLIQNMYRIFECLHGMRLFKSEVLAATALFFAQDSKPVHFLVYFSGHGNRQTGNWIFTDGEIALQEIYDLFVAYAPPSSCLSVVADCCHSGAWVEQLLSRPHDLDHGRFCIQAACQRDEVCWDTKVGGMFTKSWVSGEYSKLAKRQMYEHHGQAQLEDMQSNVKSSFSSWLPWNRFLANNPALLSCTFLASSTTFALTRECSSLISDSDVEHSQHPTASHPWAFNLLFYDARFKSLTERERFPVVAPKSLRDSTQSEGSTDDGMVPREGSVYPAFVSSKVSPAVITQHQHPLMRPVPAACKFIDLKNFWLGEN
eukprot:c20291_g1_i1.p1 GENE.c20291_g1_i1~~c20291_g1_i1.p1  ORF type:complete len:390 (-),score=57.07 c20291_g1_i1:199-1368(-)